MLTTILFDMNFVNDNICKKIVIFVNGAESYIVITTYVDKDHHIL